MLLLSVRVVASCHCCCCYCKSYSMHPFAKSEDVIKLQVILWNKVHMLSLCYYWTMHIHTYRTLYPLVRMHWYTRKQFIQYAFIYFVLCRTWSLHTLFLGEVVNCVCAVRALLSCFCMHKIFSSKHECESANVQLNSVCLCLYIHFINQNDNNERTRHISYVVHIVHIYRIKCMHTKRIVNGCRYVVETETNSNCKKHTMCLVPHWMCLRVVLLRTKYVLYTHSLTDTSKDRMRIELCSTYIET